MNTFDLIARALLQNGPGQPCDLERRTETCCITGETCLCVPRVDLIGESFTTQGIFKAPDSEWVSLDAWYAFKHRPERASSWWTDGYEFRSLKRREAWDLLTELCLIPSDKAYALYVSKSFKKHGSLVSPVNTPLSHQICVGFEAETIIARTIRFRQYMDSLERWRDNGIAREDIVKGYLMKTTKADPGVVQSFLNEAPLMRDTGLYRMLTSILPKMDHDGEDDGEDDGE